LRPISELLAVDPDDLLDAVVIVVATVDARQAVAAELDEQLARVTGDSAPA
jgi:hypothetical protein